MWIRGFYTQKKSEKGSQSVRIRIRMELERSRGCKMTGTVTGPHTKSFVAIGFDLPCAELDFVLPVSHMGYWSGQIQMEFQQSGRWKSTATVSGPHPKKFRRSRILFTMWQYGLYASLNHLSNPKDALIRIDPDHLSPNELRRADLADLPTRPENLESVAAKLTRPEINQGFVT